MSRTLLHPRKNYGYIPDTPDARDELLRPESIGNAVSAVLSLRHSPAMPSIWNQLQIGSCTAHGVGRCATFTRSLSLNVKPETPSRLWIYYMERFLEGTTASDSGAQVRDGFKVVNKMGFPVESLWPYHTTEFAVVPPQAVDEAALKDKVIKYQRITPPTVAHIKNCLATNMTPIAFGFAVYESFEQLIGADGIMPMPAAGEKLMGWHCVAIVGYDDNKQRLECANSWGEQWGDHGYFWMPYEYVTAANTNDFWQATAAN